MIELTDKTFTQEVEDYPGLFLVEFYASWCGKCTQGLKNLAEWEKKTGYKTGKVDLQRNHRLLNEYMSNGLPLYVLFLAGEPQKRKIGITDLLKEFEPPKGDFFNLRKGGKTMFLKFKESCHDKHTGEEFKPGAVREFDEERAKEILVVDGGKFAGEATECDLLGLKTNDELRAMAEELGASTKGKKAELIAAIIEAKENADGNKDQ